MKIAHDEKSREGLIRLWIKVFGDEREYVELLFQCEKGICDTFAYHDGGSVCSALYLLDCTLNFNGKDYKGKYLYAAATDPKYRQKGIMGTLISEAQEYCNKSGLDFIALVPANDELYRYYERFGFITAMHRKTVFSSTENIFEAATEISADEYFSERRRYLDNCLSFSDSCTDYVASCLKYSGLRFYNADNGALFISEQGSILLDEYISEGSAVRLITDNLSDDNKCYDEKYGMLYPINADLIRDWNYKDIYMNIALD